MSQKKKTLNRKKVSKIKNQRSEYIHKKNRKKKRKKRELERKRAERRRAQRIRERWEEGQFQVVQLEEISKKEERPEKIRPVEIQPEEVRPIEIQSEEVRPIEVQPIEIQPIEIQSEDAIWEKLQFKEVQLEEIPTEEEKPEEIQLIGEKKPEEIQLIGEKKPEEIQLIGEKKQEEIQLIGEKKPEEIQLIGGKKPGEFPQNRRYQESERRRKKKRKRSRVRYKRKRNWINNRFTKIAILGLFLIGLFMFSRPKVVDELSVEAGSDLPELSQFLRRDFKDASFAQELDEFIDMNTVADHEIKIMISGKEYTSTLHIVDTVAPDVVTKEVRAFVDIVLQPMDFIEKIEDATKTTVEFVETPDFSVPGEQKVELEVVDEGGNSTRILAKMEILEDTEPPVIEGVEELTVAVGDSISYKKNVTVSDNFDENVTLKIDNSEVDLDTPGDYPVVYIAEDAAGNVTEEETVVHVKKASVETATEEMVNRKADEILSQITTDDMSQYEVAEAIFDWVHENVRWSDGTPKTNWVQEAYRGLFDRKGDCVVYAATSKCLLTRAGIKNMDIGFSNPNRTHYWNLIDLGEGWYHFDTTRRADGRSFFYYSDADIRSYSASHSGSHAYDPSQYPKIQ